MTWIGDAVVDKSMKINESWLEIERYGTHFSGYVCYCQKLRELLCSVLAVNNTQDSVFPPSFSRPLRVCSITSSDPTP